MILPENEGDSAAFRYGFMANTRNAVNPQRH
jgi:hypothetical protein